MDSVALGGGTQCTYCALVFQQLLYHFNQLFLLIRVQAEWRKETRRPIIDKGNAII